MILLLLDNKKPKYKPLDFNTFYSKTKKMFEDEPFVGLDDNPLRGKVQLDPKNIMI